MKNLVLRRKPVTSANLSLIIGEMQATVGTWIASDRSVPCCDFLLEHVSSEFDRVTRDIQLLVGSRQFVSFDAPCGSGEASHGGEPRTWGEVISSQISGRAGSTLSVDSIGSRSVDDDLTYDSVLDAYVRKDLVRERKEHTHYERRTVENGIYLYSEEAMRNEERRIETHSPIRSSRICDRIVAQTKAKRKRYRRYTVGSFWKAPKPGESAAVEPLPGSGRGYLADRAFDFGINKSVTRSIPFKCLSCVHLNACTSWIDGRFFCRGIHDPASCKGPFTGKDQTA